MSSTELIQGAKQQIRLLEADLKDESPQVAKLLAWYRLLVVYLADEFEGKSIKEAERSKVSPETMEILNEVACILKDRELPMPSATIVEMLKKGGTTVPGKDPVSNLSAMLGNYSEWFEKDGRQGWRRKKTTP